ncbi:MAG: glycosyltransferase family 2 protein [Candidatus Aminicenantes bacterium]|nr:glycosyltransferase family 2 protein [Candidatus Aminicenantes bacterium]
MDLSIIIVTYNSQEFIVNCLDSVRKAANGIDHEIIVIDNNSGDETKALVRRCSNSIMLLKNSENHGFSKAVNMGLQRSTGDFILLVNPDTVIRSESFYPVIDFLRRNPNIGVCGGKLLNPDGSLQFSKGPFPTLLSTLYRIVLPRPMRKYDLWGYDKPRPCDWVTGAFMLIRKSLTKEIGGLDEAFFIYYEDVDYCLRTKKGGWEIYYHPGIIAYHLRPYAVSKRNLLMKREIWKSRFYYFRKNGFPLSDHLPLMFIGSLVSRFLYSIQSKS